MTTIRLTALGLLLAATAQAQTDWAAHYARRVAEFERENRQLTPGVEHVVLVGDSITEGWKQGGRTARYLPRLADRVLNRGISSDRVGPPRGVLSRLDASVFDCQPSHVVLLTGINQIGSSGSGIPGAVRHYERILSRIASRLPDVELVVVSATPVRSPYAAFKQPVLRYNAELRRLATQHGARYLDLHRRLVDGNGWLQASASADGLHLSTRGYRVWGEALEALILGSGSSAPSSGSWLARGSRGPAVAALQRRLNVDGESLEVDARFGPATEAALQRFQRRNALPPTGREDAATRAALARPPALARGSRGPEVEALQRRLNARGSSLEVDGRFGPLTETALRAFQQAQSLPVSGRADAATLTALSPGGLTGSLGQQ